MALENSPSTQTYFGSSGWAYASMWTSKQEGVMNFYRRKTPSFKQYAETLDAVEINKTRYARLTLKDTEKWYAESPPHFRFSVKAEQYMTHGKKLNDFVEWWKTFSTALAGLKEKLLCVLFQFHHNFHNTAENVRRLELLRDCLRESNVRGALEFRHESWWKGTPGASDGKGDLSYLFSDVLTFASVYVSEDSGDKETYGKTWTGLIPGLNLSPYIVESQFSYVRVHGTYKFCCGTLGRDRLLSILDIVRELPGDKMFFFNNTDSWEVTDGIPRLLHDRPTTEGEYCSGIPMFVPLLPSAISDCVTLRTLLHE